MKKEICSFADKKFSQSLKRLACQIKKISFFDKVRLFDENDLEDEFKNEFKDHLTDGSRGYGYWVWKPYIIGKALEKMEDGDTLLYIDAGCHINHSGKKRLEKYYELLQESETGMLAFQLPRHRLTFGFWGERVIQKNYYLERNWAKGDLLDYFKVRQNKAVSDTPQILPGVIFIKKCKSSALILNEWLAVFRHDFRLVDDSPSRAANLEGFIQHRHDLSAFSILCKLHNVDVLPSNEIEGVPAIINNHPILAIRDIGGRMPYKSFKLLRLTRILKSPGLFIQRLTDPEPKISERY